MYHSNKKHLLYLYITISFFLNISCNPGRLETKVSPYDLVFNELAISWDEGIPQGNAVIGSLIWEKDAVLRMSLDRTDLWDLRPSDSLSGSNYNFQWVYEQVLKGEYLPVQEKFDHPYDRLPAPSKIPGAALEFSLEQVGEPDSVHLYLNNALCEIYWKSGMKMQAFVHAFEPVGWFRIENVTDSFLPQLVPPVYNSSQDKDPELSPVTGQDLRRLGYEQGQVVKGDNQISYRQKGWGDFFYDVVVKWEKKGNNLIGVWSVTSSLSNEDAEIKADKALARGIHKDYISHLSYWDKFWEQSSVCIPDEVLAKQYANEIYKLGSVAREYAYPISLQAVWTADNGKLPPWKGDYHHDLNTQLSYWPFYTGNYLNEGLGYLNTLWEQREVHKKYTREYWQKEGLNVPGVCTLSGEPMAGWIQYAMSPTVSAWLSQHFYLHYKYSADQEFLKERAYPYIKEVATFLEELTFLDEDGIRRLPLSSSPEIYDNSIKAWFGTMTNYDLALVYFVFEAASELAAELSLSKESEHWVSLKAQLPDFDLDETGGLTFAKDYPYNVSHRHFSNAMAIHPLGIIDRTKGSDDSKIITNTIRNFERMGPDYWTGYSYSWFGNLKARAFDGDGAAKELRTFAECFCLRNTFHANGDQTKSGKSKYTYRPFTLEGNFAFAAGIQEMLIQSHSGFVNIFPAVPESWNDISFKKLRTYGGFLVSADCKNRQVKSVTVYSEQGGLFRLEYPFGLMDFKIKGGKLKSVSDRWMIEVEMHKGQTVTFTAV